MYFSSSVAAHISFLLVTGKREGGWDALPQQHNCKLDHLCKRKEGVYLLSFDFLSHGLYIVDTLRVSQLLTGVGRA